MVRRNKVVAALLGLTVAGGALLASGEEPVDADKADAKVLAIAERVEQLRGLQFERMPKIRRVTAAQLKKEAIKQQEELSGKDLLALDADGEFLKLLGFIDKETDLAGSAPDTSDIAGTYEFDTKRLTIVKNVRKSDVPPEIVYAHELAHALEDQAFGLDNPNARGDDSAQAWRAVGEGSATFLEARYAREHFGADVTSRQIARSDPAAVKRRSSDVYAENNERFVYLDGARFIARLHRAGGWKLVDEALQKRPPRTTAEIVHPDLWLDGFKQARVELDTKALEEDHDQLTAGQLGEFDTTQMLLMGTKVKRALRGAEGWIGGRYELWQASKGKQCSMPCVERDVLVLAWSWDSPEEVAEFTALLPGYLERFQKLRETGPGRWSGRTTHAALHVTEKETTLVFAPNPKLAQKLATTVRGRP